MAGKGNAKVVVTHPKSRKVRQLQRQSRREKRISEQKGKRNAKAALEAARFFWFREQCLALGRTKLAFSREEAQVLTEQYLKRNDEEIVALKSMRNPTAGRIKILEAMKTSEADDFNSSKGIVIPDITNSDNLEILTSIWDGRADTAGVVRRVGLTRTGVSPAAPAVTELEGKLLTIDEVRERSIDFTSRKARKFQTMKRVQSVKKTPTAEDVWLRSKKRGVDLQAKRLRQGREAVLKTRRAN
ncbi:Protein of unknown function (DUF2962), putative [Trypanosoma equiperdum]|uniref:Uncharacterized protein n=2 Tax=Trypanozoon TaxID=39700 RepID=Q38AJ7_TRYB2|nr:hypothetical protein, conserved [Trypanosoma brucei brucei TREU927]EAN78173.1 hypothetical protein, conserved [Trypanosoma brucei brucei TREU927]SCU65501.1 Protein of unknown function (DUF2962), putative [Trypanosoma equiperdum]